MGASVVACCDAPPVFELCEEVLDVVALAIERLIVSVGDFPASARWNAGLDAPGDQRLAKGGAVVAAVGDKGFGRWEGIEDEACALVIAHLSFREQHNDRTAAFVAHGVELRVQTAFRSPDTTGNSPFLSRLAAVRCAFRCVASIMIRSGLGPSPASPAKMRSKTPSRLQRMKRL